MEHWLNISKLCANISKTRTGKAYANSTLLNFNTIVKKRRTTASVVQQL